MAVSAHSSPAGAGRPAPAPRRRSLAWAALVLLAAACARGGARGGEAALPRLAHEQVVQLIPGKVADREGWAEDVLAALEAQGLWPAPPSVCAVLAVIEQESGFSANPVVPDLPRIVRRQLDAHASRLGPLGRPALDKVLAGRAPGQSRTFAERLETVRTERDLDRLFQELLAHYEREYPRTYATANVLGELFGSGGLAQLNPITTAGSMQVSVRYAAQLAAGEENEVDAEDEARVREELYTRRGGVRYGTARLLGYEAGYDDLLYRFADYNAGLYASRNAALQAQLSELTGMALVPDGDLLAYDDSGEPSGRDSRTLQALLAFRERWAPELSERQVRRDVRREKTFEFESTDTYRALRRAYERAFGKAAPYARLPQVAIKSPKLRGERSTEWFARSVERRFRRCMERHAALGEGAPPS